MARTTKAKAARNPQPKRAIDDSFVAPKARKTKTVTLAEALAESGETMDDLRTPADDAPARKEREVGTSNLAQTIRSHRRNYTTVLHPNGKKTQNNGDPIAQDLLNVPLEEMRRFNASQGRRPYHDCPALREMGKAGLNPGHERMCIGNWVRAEIKKGNEVVTEWLMAFRQEQGE